MSTECQEAPVWVHCGVQLPEKGQKTDLSFAGEQQHLDSTFTHHGWYQPAITQVQQQQNGYLKLD